MERPPPGASPTKTSSIPRLSKLPVPRSFAGATPNNEQNVLSRSAVTHGSLRGDSPRKTIPKPSTTAKPTPHIPPPRSNVQASSIGRPASRLSQISRPTSALRRPTSRLAHQNQQTSSSTSTSDARPEEESNDQLGSLDGFRTASRQGFRDESPPYLEEASADPPEERTPKPKRSSRLSLSDRTIESLSSLPSTPTTNRRRSSFFAPPSPMVTSARPATAMSARARPGTSDGAVARSLARPASPLRRAPLSARPAIKTSVDFSSSIGTPTRRSVTALPRQPQTPSGVPASLRKPAATPSLGTAPVGRLALRPPSKATASSAGSPKPRPPVNGTASRKIVQAPRAPQLDNVEATNRGSTSSPSKGPIKSSAALREQIARAKAAKRAVTTKQDSFSDAGTSDFNFESSADPFNQAPIENKGLLRKRIDGARADGRLNIAGMGLDTIPNEVLTMYDPEQMADSKLSWSETVDLVRFVAADNELTTISDDVFPDIDRETAAIDDDAKGLQFGGIELLDLHGNSLQTVPLGIRRLERLTSLDLVCYNFAALSSYWH